MSTDDPRVRVSTTWVKRALLHSSELRELRPPPSAPGSPSPSGGGSRPFNLLALAQIYSVAVIQRQFSAGRFDMTANW